MFITNEYTTLKSTIDGNEIIIKPNIPFEGVKGEYQVTSSARVIDQDTGEVTILDPRYKVIDPFVKEVRKVTKASKPKRKPVLKDVKDGE